MGRNYVDKPYEKVRAKVDRCRKRMDDLVRVTDAIPSHHTVPAAVIESLDVLWNDLSDLIERIAPL